MSQRLDRTRPPSVSLTVRENQSGQVEKIIKGIEENDMDKKKAKDPQIWKRLGLELAALHDLIVEIQCDKDYASVMDSKTWDRLYKLTYHLDIVRSCAEERMAKNLPDWSTRTFYPVDRSRTTVAGEAFREEIKREFEKPEDGKV